MTGPNFLLDTNFIVGLVKGNLETINTLGTSPGKMPTYSCSVINRIEALGYPKIQYPEEELLNRFFLQITVHPITQEITEKTIQIMRVSKLKLIDSLVAATAIVHDLKLLTLDKELDKQFELLNSSRI